MENANIIQEQKQKTMLKALTSWELSDCGKSHYIT